MKITKDKTLLLKPGTACGKELPAEKISSILDGSIWQPSECWKPTEEEPVLIGQPAYYLEELVAALARFFGTQRLVQWLFIAMKSCGIEDPLDGIC